MKLPPDSNVVTGGYYSVSRLVSLALPGLPRSAKGWYDLVEREKWEFREVDGQGGRAGKRREYRLPKELVRSVQQILLRRAFETYRTQVGAGEPLTTAIANFVNDYNIGSASVDAVDGVDAVTFDQVEDALQRGQRGIVTATMSSGKSATTMKEVAETAAGLGKAVLVVGERSRLGPDQDGADRVEMLLAVLRAAEEKLKGPMSPDLARKVLDVAIAWRPFAVQYPDLSARIEALRSAAELYLAIGD